MAFEKIAELAKPITALPDRVTGEAAWLKEYFDANPRQLMEAYNHLVDALRDKSAAQELGFAPTDGIAAQTVQTAIEMLKNMIDDAATGAIPDGSLTGMKVQDGSLGEEKLSQSAQGKLNGAHSHGGMSAAGAIGASSGKVIVTGTGGVMEAVTQQSAFNREFGANTPQAVSETGAVGVSSRVARADHAHPIGDELKAYIKAQIDAITDFSGTEF